MDLYRQNPQFQLAEKICEVLSQKGHQALLAGGCVRDFLLGRVPNDFDVATDALPEVVEKLFPKTVAVGKNFGVIVVVEGSQQVEVATFRKDGPYKDGRHPASVEFSRAEEDAQRRDFTVNGLFYDLKSGGILDYVSGLVDLPKKQLRAIGHPGQRFEEDHLRILRAVRFAAQLGFEIEPQTWEAVKTHRNLLLTVSGERIQDELSKLLMSPDLGRGLKLLYDGGVLATLIQSEPLLWKPPQLVWAREEQNLEDHWFRFFFWIRKLIPTGASIYFFESLCEKWKFSRDLKQKTLKSMQWTFEKAPFQDRPLGELLALSYEPENLRGLMEYADEQLIDTEKPVFEKFQERRAALGAEKPKPWVVAADFANRLQGESLGRVLRHCYWVQLEGLATDKEDLLKKSGV